MQRLDNRRAAGRLRRINFATAVFDQADIDEFLKALG
jgi:hypothetical protein